MGTYFVTGASGGFGTHIVRNLQDQGHVVIAPNRQETDLSLMSEIYRKAKEVEAQVDSLDGLILNAGVALKDREITPEGFEATFAVNYLGAFLLAHRLLPLLRKAESGRIVLVGSSDHLAVREANIDSLVAGDDYRYTRAYAASKAVAMAAMLEMSQRLHGDVQVNIADPGWARTGLHRDATLPIRILLALGRPFQNSPEDSARIITDLVTKPGSSGEYRGRKGPSRMSDLVSDTAFMRRSYDDSAQLLISRGLATPDLFLDSAQ